MDSLRGYDAWKCTAPDDDDAPLPASEADLDAQILHQQELASQARCPSCGREVAKPGDFCARCTALAEEKPEKPKHVPCDCDGGRVDCEECGGTGQGASYGGGPFFGEERNCRKCRGRGYHWCSTCSGEGRRKP